MKNRLKQTPTKRRSAALAAAAHEYIEALESRVLLSTVTVNAAATYQTLQGFGGDYAEGYFNSYANDPIGTYTLQNLAPAQVRVPLLMQDWAPTQGGSYSNTGEVTQVFQLMQQAQAQGAQIVASIWDLPNWMVTNPSSVTQLNIAPSMYGTVANAIAAWVQEAATYGVNVSDVSFNEPDGGFDVQLSSTAMDSFIKTSGAIFQQDGLSTKWMVGDTDSVNGAAAYIAPILADPDALPYINAIAMHSWWSDQAPASEFTAIANLGQQYDLPVWSTETNFGPDNLGNYNSWNSASEIAQTYLQVLNLAGASTVDYWEYQNDDPLVGAFNTPFPSYYVVQQFSAYLPAGSQVVQSVSDDGNIQTIAAKDGDNFTVEALNLNSAGTSTTFNNLPNGTYTLITTDASANAASSVPLMVSNGTLTVNLPANSFNTLTTLAPAGTPAAPPAGNGTGLRGVYFADEIDSNGNLTHLLNPAYSEVDPTLNFNWGDIAPASSLPPQTFSVQWTGSVQAQYSETYTFVTLSDDGVRLWVNGQELINDWTGHAATQDQGTITLTAGQQYSITVDYYQNGGGAQLALAWQSPSTPLEIIPSTLLYPNTPTGGGTGLLGQYFVNTGGSSNDPPASPFPTDPTVTRVDPLVDFNWLWPSGSPDPSIPHNYFEAQWTGYVVPQYSEDYTFNTTSDDGVRLWVNGQELVNDWTDQSATGYAGSINLIAGQQYSIVLQYFQGSGGSQVDLQWQSPSTPLEDVPTAQLYPASISTAPSPTVSVSAITALASQDFATGGTNIAQFQFTRGGDLSQPLTVDYTMSGTAINGADYQTLSGVVTFATGYSVATVNLVPDGDPNPGTVQSATLTMTASSSYTFTNGSATASIEEPPVSPSPVSALPGIGQVVLSWPAVAGAVSYNIYRSTTPGTEGTTPYLSDISSTSATDTTATNGSTYYYAVTAVAGEAESAFSTQVVATPGLAGPTTLTATSGADAVDLSWSAVPGATSYNVYRGAAPGGESATPFAAGLTTTTLADLSATVGTPYYYYVAAVTTIGTSLPSPEANAFASPATPASLTATGGSGQIVLSWTPVLGATSYDLYKSLTPGGETTIATYTGISTDGYTDTAVTTGTPYYYTVTAVENGVQSLPSSEATATAITVAGPATLTAAAATDAINLAWSAVPGATGYSIYRGTVAGGENATPILSGSTDTTYSDITVTPGTPYYYIVTASVASGSTSASPEASAEAIPAAPATFAAAGGPGQIVLSWTPVPGATSYDLYKSLTPGGETTIATYTGISTDAYTDTAVTTGTPYYYTVTAVEGSSQSGQSTEATATASAATGPATLAATAATDAINLAWSPVPGATGYDIYYGTTPGGEGATPLVSLSATTYSDITATPGTTYYFTVDATVASGITSTSPEASAAALPATPTSLTATGGIAQIVLAWAADPDAASYDIYRSTTPGGEGATPYLIGVSATTYTDTAVSSSTPYYYTVTAVQGVSQSAQSTEATATAITVAGPATLTATAATDAINLAWSAVPGATGYSIYRGTAAGGENATPILSGSTDTTYSDITVTPGTPYYYIVTASVASGSTSASPEASAEAIPAAPATFAAAGGPGQIVLSWTPVPGATSYDLYKSITPGGESTIATYTGISTDAYTDTTVTTGTPYYYTVTAVEGSSQSGQSTEATATASAATGPATLAATPSANTITLSWPTVLGAVSYNIYRGTSPGGEIGIPLATGVSATTYSDTSVTPGTPYYYEVTASTPSGESAASPEASAAALPSAPATVTTAPAAGLITVDWSAVPGATSYDIYRGATPGGEGATPYLTGVSATTVSDTSVTAGLTYYYTVTAVETGVQSAQSTEASGSAATVAGPTTLTATPSTDTITLSWAPVPGANGYNIYRGTMPNGESATPLAAGVGPTTYTDSNVTPGIAYYYIVKASVTSGLSGASPEANAAALPSSPTTLTATGGIGQIALSWSTVNGATSYDIYRGTTPGGEGTTPYLIGVSATTYIDTAVTVGAPYYYTVTAVETGLQGVQSTEATATATTPAAPATLAATGGTGQIALSWSTVVGATSYDIYRSTASGGEGTTPYLTGVSTTTYTDTAVTAGTPYYYTVTAIETGLQGVQSTEATATATTPAAPVALSATGGTGQIALSWSTVNGATSYDIYRSTASGGEGTTPYLTGVSTTTYTDTAVTAGTPYYYTVTAVETGLQSTQSTQATASAGTTTTTLTDLDIGSPGIAGSASLSNGIYTVKGGGSDIWNNADQFNFDSTAISGNVTLVTEVTSQTAADVWSKSGIMVRDSTAAGAANFAIFITPDNGVNIQWRSTDGGSSSNNGVYLTPGQLPIWLEIIRSGNTFTGYYSTQNTANPASVTWTLLGPAQTIAMSSALAGLAVTSHNNGLTSTATFANFSVNGSGGATGSAPAAPATLTATAGTGQIALSWSPVNGATSYDIYRGTASGGESTTPYAIGISTTTYTDTAVTVGTPYYYTVEAVDNYGNSTASPEAHATVTAAATPPAAPATLTAAGGTGQIALSWSTVNGATSYDIYRSTASGGEGTTPYLTGVSTTTYTDTAVTAGTPYYYTVTAVETGLQSTQSTQATATASAGTTATTLTDLDIGSPGIAGSASLSNGIYTVKGGGSDIWNNADQFNFDSTAISGNVTLVTEVTSQTAADVWSKSGIMVRDSTAAGAANFAIFITPDNGVNIQWRSTDGGSSSNNGVYLTPGQLPIWLEIIRSGNTFTGYYSTQNTANPASVTWTLLGPAQTIAMSSALAGLAVTSHNNGLTSTATFANFSVNGSGGATGSAPAAPATLTATAGTGQIALSWSPVNGATSYDIYRGTASGGEGTTPYLTGISTTTYTDTAVTVGTPYYYTVEAVDNYGNSTASPEAHATVTAAATPPAAPATLTAVGGTGQIALSWSTVNGATSYDIYRSTASGGEGTTPYLTGVSTTTYTDTAVTAGTPYYYTVTAVETGLQSTQSTQATATASAGTTATTLTDLDIGSPALAGSASVSNGVYTISGNGSDIWNNADQFNFDYTTMGTATTLVTRVTSQTAADVWSKAGIMVRDSTAAGAANVALFVTPENGINLQWRSTDGGTSVNTGVYITPGLLPVWLKLVRSGNTFTAYYSTQSTSNEASVVWIQLGSPVTVTMSTMYAGLAVTSHNLAALSQATFDNFSLT